MLWEDVIREAPLPVEASDVDDPREPYNDEIPQEMWQELFNDVDDDLSDNEN